MPEFEGNFHESLEEDIAHLSEEVEGVKSSEQAEKIEKKEVVKKSVKSLEKKKPSKRVDYGQGKTKPKKARQKPKNLLPSYMEEGDVDPKVRLAVEELMDLVFHKGILAALKASKKHPPFVQDAFHDALAEKLVPILEERGVI